MQVYMSQKDRSKNSYSVHYDTIVAANGGNIPVNFKRDGFERGSTIRIIEALPDTKPRILRRYIKNELHALAKTLR